jgi:hypothetical protein
MSAPRLMGVVIMFLAVTGAVFYILWWAGLMPLLRQDDAVRLAALLVMLFLFTAVGFVGYVMAVTKPPQHNKSKNTSELFFHGPGWPSSQAAACRAALQGCKSPPRLSPPNYGMATKSSSLTILYLLLLSLRYVSASCKRVLCTFPE